MDNLSKRKKIIIFSAVLVIAFSCTMVLMNVFGEDSPSRMMSDSALGKKGNADSEIPGGTLETNEGANSGMSGSNPESDENTAGETPDGTSETEIGAISDEIILEPSPAEKDDPEQAQQEIRELVEAFGKTLQKVSLLAPEDVVVKSMEENYGSFVTTELLKKWQSDPQSAPGRTVSSPWPDRIEILCIGINNKNQYIVYGEIIEITSVELEKGGMPRNVR